MYLTIALFVSALLRPASGTSLSSRSLSGEATFYGGNLGGGACSFSTYTLPSGVFGTALSESNWDGSANCGACVSVTGPNGNSITAMVVDECPGCQLNQLDLFPDAFSALADPVKGMIPITWDYVDCPITTPLQLHNKDGVSAYWFSMQVVNANQGVKSLEVSTDGGSTWQPTTLQDYNFFEGSSGFGTTVDVRVTSDAGGVVVVNNVGISSGSIVTASSNFGSSGAASVKAPAATGLPISASPTISGPPSATPTSIPGAIFDGHSLSTSYSTSTHYITTSFPNTTTIHVTTTVSKTKTKCKPTSSSKPAYTPSPIALNSTLRFYPTATAGTVLPSLIIPTPSSIESPSSVVAGATSAPTATVIPIPVNGAFKASVGTWHLFAVLLLAVLIAH